MPRKRSRSASDESVPAASAKPNWWTSEALRGALLWVLIVGLYVPTFSSGFIWDDDDYVTGNRTLTSAEGLRQIWFDPAATPQYYPVVHTTFWIEYHLWGLNPAGYHIVNVLLHATAAVLVGLILSRLGIPGAWLAAVLFGVHPVHVETVAWVTERKNVLSAVYYLLAMLTFLKVFRLEREQDDEAGTTARPASESNRPLETMLRYALGLALYGAALLSKSVTCSLPAVLVLFILFRRGRVTVREFAMLTPLFAIGGAMAWRTASLERAHVGASGSGFEWTPAERFLIAGRALWSYARLLAMPVGQAFIYPRWRIDTSSAWQWALAVSAFLVPVVIAMRSRRMSGPLVAVLFFGGTLLPALGFVNIYPMRYSYIADHFQYLASIGLLTLLAAGWAKWASRRVLSMVARTTAVLIVIALAGLTLDRESVFRGPKSLWDDTLRQDPTSMIANLQRARIAMIEDDVSAAVGYFQRGLDHRTDDAESYIFRTNLAIALSRTNRSDAAIEQCRLALSQKPDYLLALNTLANIYARQQKYDEAIPLFRRALVQDADNAVVQVNLGNALAITGDFAGSEAAYRKAIQANPNSAMAHLELSKLLARQKKFADAEAECLRALEIEPSSVVARQLLEKIRAEATK